MKKIIDTIMADETMDEGTKRTMAYRSIRYMANCQAFPAGTKVCHTVEWLRNKVPLVSEKIKAMLDAGVKLTKENARVEHENPCSQTLDRYLATGELDLGRVCIVTREEDEALDKAKLRIKGDKRWEQVGIVPVQRKG